MPIDRIYSPYAPAFNVRRAVISPIKAPVIAAAEDVLDVGRRFVEIRPQTNFIEKHGTCAPQTVIFPDAMKRLDVI